MTNNGKTGTGYIGSVPYATDLYEVQRMKTSVSEQLQRLSAYVLERQDEERRWIAAQLHEVTAQNVSAIAIYVASLQQKGSLPSEVESILAKCQSLCEQSVEQILALSRLLHPPVLDRLGLAPSLHRFIKDFAKGSGMQVEFELESEIGRLPLEMETHLFRIAQEGLSNILRHSRGLHAVVRLERQSEQVTLQIEDFGQGISDATTSAVSDGEEGLGILGMQERLRKIGGHLEIRSSNQGRMLTAKVPLCVIGTAAR